MSINIPQIYIASCASFLLGALAVIGLAYAASAYQRRQSKTGRRRTP